MAVKGFKWGNIRNWAQNMPLQNKWVGTIAGQTVNSYDEIGWTYNPRCNIAIVDGDPASDDPEHSQIDYTNVGEDYAQGFIQSMISRIDAQEALDWDYIGTGPGSSSSGSNRGAIANFCTMNDGTGGVTVGVANSGFYTYLYFYNGSRSPLEFNAATFISIDMSSATEQNYHAYLIGMEKTYADQSKLLRVWWVLTNASNQFVAQLLIANITESNVDDGEGGGGDTIDYGTLPSIDAINSGFISVYKPTIAQLRALASEMWSQNALDSIKKMFTNPMECIITLNIVPSGADIHTSGTDRITLGTYQTAVTGVDVIDRQYYEKDMGSYALQPLFNNILDYAPHTFVQLFLPYIGMVELNTDDVMGHTLSVKYRCDILTGQIVATVLIDGSVYNQYQGNFSISCPVTGANFAQMYMGIVKAGLGLIGGAVSGNALQAAGSMLGAASSSKIEYSRGSNLGMTAGYLGNQRCFLVVSRPVDKNTVPTSYATANAMLDQKVSQYYLSGQGFGTASYVLAVSGT